jgi:hypothetical protein
LSYAGTFKCPQFRYLTQCMLQLQFRQAHHQETSTWWRRFRQPRRTSSTNSSMLRKFHGWPATKQTRSIFLKNDTTCRRNGESPDPATTRSPFCLLAPPPTDMAALWSHRTW